MPRLRRLLFAALATSSLCVAQDLSPRAYVITPLKSNAITLNYSFSDGNVLFDPAIPIKDGQGKINATVATLYHSFGLLGRSVNVTASLPYAFGHLQGKVFGQDQEVYRSGLLDSVYRISVNLKGGPAMAVPEFMKWRQKLLVGVSLKVIAPTGQYDPARLVNQGSNRWAFKPEIGLSQRWGKFVLDGYTAVWFFTENHSFYTGTNTQSQSPMGAFEMHLSYDVKPRLWFSFDANYWVGGRTTVNDRLNVGSLQSNSRIGVTASAPISRHQSLKISYSAGAYVIFGGDYRTLSMAWQYSWIGTKFR